MKVIKIGAKWCPDCEVMSPRWKEIEKEHSWLETEYIGVDENPEAMNKYKVLALPCFIFFNREEKEILRFTKIVEKDILVKAILENKDK